MAKQNFSCKFSIRCSLILVTFISLASANNGNETAIGTQNVTSVISDNTSSESELVTSTTLPPTTTISTTLSPEHAAAVAFLASLPKVQTELPETIPDFIRKMMKRFGEAKAGEAFASLDQLPLGLVMKIMLVEMDKDLASDIVAMQRYAQASDKALITMIGRIVAGDKNVPKDLFVMDMKLMKFPWWMRIRERMLANLEKYVAAYSLVPVAARNAVNGANKETKRFEATVDSLKSELAAAVANSATESSNKVGLGLAAAVPAAPVSASNAASIPNLESLKLSFLNPLLQQQQLLGALSLANAASNTQAQQLLPQTQQATNFNPFSLFG